MENLKHKIVTLILILSLEHVSAHQNFGNLPFSETSRGVYFFVESNNFNSKTLYNGMSERTELNNKFKGRSELTSTLTLCSVRRAAKRNFIQQVVSSNLKLTFKLSRNLNLVITYN